ncbi:hypothetical protein ACFV4Q_20570 [Streptomyces nojiriensis]|uniref:hypothetical protein n=1 Tax=Streptomyces nojiriensis TaxID=66374 RepID=UPI00364A9AE8
MGSSFTMPAESEHSTSRDSFHDSPLAAYWSQAVVRDPVVQRDSRVPLTAPRHAAVEEQLRLVAA